MSGVPMRVRTLLLPALTFLLVGCGSEEQLRRVELEVGDLKLQVFKLRQQVEDGNKRAQEEQQAAKEGRAQDRRFQADLQESLRQLQETTRGLNNRMGSLPKNPTPAPKPAAEPPTASAPSAPGAPAPQAPAAPSLPEDERAFNTTVLDYNRGNYPLAIEGLEAFVKAYPDSAKRPEALFFLGLSHYNAQAYAKAQGVFERIIKDHAASPQFLPAKLKRAQCLLRQGLKPSAVKAFQEMVEGFSGSAEARTAQEELADLGL